VHEILSSEDLIPRAIAIAAMIIEGAPKAIAATKKMVYFSRSESRLAREQYAAPMLEDIQKSNDIKEGRLAFIEKRKPKWSG
jgi:enoyl-CoA hydratase/carnithine racemase